MEIFLLRFQRVDGFARYTNVEGNCLVGIFDGFPPRLALRGKAEVFIDTETIEILTF